LSDPEYLENLRSKADNLKHFALLSNKEKHNLYSMIEKGDTLKKAWLSPHNNHHERQPSCYDLIKHLIEVYQGEGQRLTYEIAKVVDFKVDALMMRVSDLKSEVKNAVQSAK